MESFEQLIYEINPRADELGLKNIYFNKDKKWVAEFWESDLLVFDTFDEMYLFLKTEDKN